MSTDGQTDDFMLQIPGSYFKMLDLCSSVKFEAITIFFFTFGTVGKKHTSKYFKSSEWLLWLEDDIKIVKVKVIMF